MSRISSLTSGYLPGDLSPFPKALDTQDTLYQAANNATTITAQGISFSSSFIVVEDASQFPPFGLIKIGLEIVYYASRTDTVFKELVRGFVGTRQSPWPKGTIVANSVMAEHHNAEKDAVINIENDLGINDLPSATSLNGILKAQENRFLAPRPLFRAFPLSGPAPLTVTFQNFSGGDPIRYLWDFGDGSTTTEISPIHTYLNVGTYTVNLNMITSLNSQGIITKVNYINVTTKPPNSYFYATPLIGTANSTVITFIDQTPNSNNIQSRYWIFDDGTFDTEMDADIHTTTHIYTQSGNYTPSLLVVFTDGSKRKLDLGESIIIR